MDKGTRTAVFRIGSSAGLEAVISTLGASVIRVRARDGVGELRDIALGVASVADQTASERAYIGSTVGRVANRIRGARFSLDGSLHRLSANDGDNCLHGGSNGFSSRNWSVAQRSSTAMTLELASSDGDMGFPGALHVAAEYAVQDTDLRVDYTATTTAPTVVNLASHVYWNLGGGGMSVAEHELRLAADRFLAIDAELLPTGETAVVDDTPFDFRTARVIGDPLVAPDEQLRNGRGYDHCFVLSPTERDRLRFAAELRSAVGGFALDVHTTQPALHLYTGNHFDGTAVGLCGESYDRLAGVALEAQGFPDAPNQPDFPSIVLRPGSIYRQTTVYRVRSTTCARDTADA